MFPRPNSQGGSEHGSLLSGNLRPSRVNSQEKSTGSGLNAIRATKIVDKNSEIAMTMSQVRDVWPLIVNIPMWNCGGT